MLQTNKSKQTKNKQTISLDSAVAGGICCTFPALTVRIPAAPDTAVFHTYFN